MAGREGLSGVGPDGRAQRSADRLALALEEVGFDVGRAFPMLGNGVDREGRVFIEVGRVAQRVAGQLSDVLTRAARLGVTVPSSVNGPEAGGDRVRHDPEEGQ